MLQMSSRQTLYHKVQHAKNVCSWAIKSVYREPNKYPKQLTSMDFCSSEDAKITLCLNLVLTSQREPRDGPHDHQEFQTLNSFRNTPLKSHSSAETLHRSQGNTSINSSNLGAG